MDYSGNQELLKKNSSKQHKKSGKRRPQMTLVRIRSEMKQPLESNTSLGRTHYLHL